MAATDAPTLRPAFAARHGALPVDPSAGVQVREIAGFGLASVQARKDAALTTPPRDFTLIPTGPRTWLAFRQAARDGFADDVADFLGPSFSICDQAGGYGLIRLSGSRARDLLMKGVFLDLDPVAFPAGKAASTTLAHIGVTLWLERDGETFALLCFRSLAASLWDWLAVEAAEYGLAQAG